MEGLHATGHSCNAWVFLVVVAFLYGSRGVFASIYETVLNSAAKEDTLRASKFLVLEETLQSFVESRGLQNVTMDWIQDCKLECYQNNGTCNLLNGSCQCPVGRVHSDAGVLCTLILQEYRQATVFDTVQGCVGVY